MIERKGDIAIAEKGNIAGVSTVGSLTGYAVETVAGTKPTKFIMLHRINASDEITIDVETIDASALEDEIERTIAGRGSTGGTFNVTVNVTDETIDEWEKLIAAYKTGKASGLSMWYEEYFPSLQKAFLPKLSHQQRFQNQPETRTDFLQFPCL